MSRFKGPHQFSPIPGSVSLSDVEVWFVGFLHGTPYIAWIADVCAQAQPKSNHTRTVPQLARGALICFAMTLGFLPVQVTCAADGFLIEEDAEGPVLSTSFNMHIKIHLPDLMTALVTWQAKAAENKPEAEHVQSDPSHAGAKETENEQMEPQAMQSDLSHSQWAALGNARGGVYAWDNWFGGPWAGIPAANSALTTERSKRRQRSRASRRRATICTPGLVAEKSTDSLDHCAEVETTTYDPDPGVEAENSTALLDHRTKDAADERWRGTGVGEAVMVSPYSGRSEPEGGYMEAVAKGFVLHVHLDSVSPCEDVNVYQCDYVYAWHKGSAPAKGGWLPIDVLQLK